MSFPTQAGKPNLYDADYLPKVYAAVLLVEFYASTVIAAIANTDYENDITKYGSEVVVRVLPTIQTHRYVKGQGLDIQNPSPSSVTMKIEKGQYFAFEVDIVDKVQSDIRISEEWAQHGGEQLKIEIDKWFLSDVYSDVSADNSGTTAGVDSNNINLGTSGAPYELTKANVIDFIADCGQVLDEQNVPETNRWFVIPPWVSNLIKKSDLKDASVAGDGTSIMRNGRLGMIDRFTLYMSNNLYKTVADSATSCVFGHKVGLSFASQITESKQIDMGTAGFGEILKQLQVFDWEVFKPEAVGHAYVARG